MNNKGLNVLSLFDGTSCCRVALDRANIKVDNYYASEIDKYAIQIAQKNYKDTKQLGSVTDFEKWNLDWSNIDLVTGGFPCQSWSTAGKQRGDKDERGMLFWVMLGIMKKVLYNNPKAKFLIENVKMKKEFEQYITFHTNQALGKVNKILINSSLVSAQNRQRWYWTNIENIEQPENKGVLLKDVLEKEGYTDRDKSMCLDANYGRGSNLRRYFHRGSRQIIFNTLSLLNDLKTNKPSIDNINFLYNQRRIEWRILTPLECERLQTLPDKVFYAIIDLKELLCLDQAKNFVNAVEKNHKLLKLVLSAEKKELKEYVNIAIQSMSVSHQSKKYIAQKSVDTQTSKQAKECISHKQTELNTSANNVENNVLYQSQEIEVDSVAVNVPMNLIEGRIAHNGKAESLLKDNNSLNQKNGKNVQKLYLKEIMELVENVGLGITKKIEKSSIYTTSYHLSTQNTEQILTILYYFAKNVIDGRIAKRIQIKSLYLSLTDGYTYGVSNSQRYKMIGNGWTISVISHIFSKGLKGEQID